MTREEAIKVIKSIIDVEEEYGGKDNIDALNMAISALEQEQDMTIAYLMGKYEDKEPCRKDCRLCKEFDECENGKKGHENGTSIGYSIGECKDYEPCEDVMSRILQRMWNCRGKHTTSIDKVKMEQIIRDELPPVTPSRPKAHWIVFDHGLGCKYYKCDKCGNTVQMPRNNPYNGCPYCFAEMESSDAENSTSSN